MRAGCAGVRARVQVGGWGRRTTLADVRKLLLGGRLTSKRPAPDGAAHLVRGTAARSRTDPSVCGDDGREAPHPTRDGHEAARALGAAARVLVAPASAQRAGARRVLSQWSARNGVAAAACWLRCTGCGALAASRGLRHARAAAHLSRQPKCATRDSRAHCLSCGSLRRLSAGAHVTEQQAARRATCARRARDGTEPRSERTRRRAAAAHTPALLDSTIDAHRLQDADLQRSLLGHVSALTFVGTQHERASQRGDVAGSASAWRAWERRSLLAPECRDAGICKCGPSAL